MAKNKSLFKTIAIIVLTVVTGICLILDGWYIYLHFFGKEKVASTTITTSDMTVTRVDSVTGETVTETKCFIELNVYDNCFEVKFNELYDENQQAFYSYGIQLMVKEGKNITFSDENIADGNYYREIYSECIEDKKEYSRERVGLLAQQINYRSLYNKVYSSKVYKNLDFYEYQSFDNFETPLQSTRLQDNEEFFKIQVQDKGVNSVYALSFINYDTKKELGLLGSNESLITDNLTLIESYLETEVINKNLLTVELYSYHGDCYRAIDVYYFLDCLIDSLKGLAPGFKGETYLKMPDVFDFWKYNESTSVYDKIGDIDDASVNLSSLDILYSKIKLTVHEGNLTKSSQSMFNKYREIQNYDSEPAEEDLSDYLTGKTIIKATLEDLVWKSTGESGKYKFSLSEEFKERWKLYKKTSYIKVVIDSDYLNENNLTYSGFNLDEDFVIYKIEMTDGQVLYEGVKHV